jgi:hypothetical protein
MPALIAGALLLPVILLCAWLYAPFANSMPVLCVWRRFTGMNCLTCGLTRALCLFVRGEAIQALRMNWLLVPLLVSAAAVTARSLILLLRRAPPNR